MAIISVTILIGFLKNRVLCEDIKLTIGSVPPYPKYQLSTSASQSFITQAYVKQNILRNWLTETNGEMFYLWNFLVRTIGTKSILGKMILISVLLRRKKCSRIILKLRTRITDTITKSLTPTLPYILLPNKKCSLLSKLLILHRIINI